MLTVKISTTVVKVLVSSATVDDTSDQRGTAKFTVVDESGTTHYQPGQPVEITDTFAVTPSNPDGLIFAGYIDNVVENNLWPNPAMTSACQCIGKHYLADKRYYSGPEFSSDYAGDIAAEFLSVLAAEGVKAAFARDHTSTFAQWSAGTLSNTVASPENNGSLVLDKAGTSVQARFDSKSISTSNGAQVVGSTVTNASMNIIQYSAQCTMPGTNAFMYTKIWSGSYTIQLHDKLSYEVWINKSSPQIMAAVDFICSDGTTFRDTGDTHASFYDHQSMSPHPKTDLTGLADNQWYYREFPIGYGVPTIVGKTITSISVAFEGDTTGQYIAYFRRIKIFNGENGNINLDIFHDTSVSFPTIPQIILDNGYTNLNCHVVKGYESYGVILVGITDMSPAGIYQSSLLSWDADVPEGCEIQVRGTVDYSNSAGNATVFFVQANNSPIPGLVPGQSLADLGTYYYMYLYNNGNDPLFAPIWRSLTVQVNPAYKAFKSDFRCRNKTTADYENGSKSNLSDAKDILQIPGYQAKFDFSAPSASLFGSNSPIAALANRTLALSTGTASEVKYRLDVGGNTWKDSVIEVDVKIDAGVQSGIVYRTTDWSNAGNSFGYLAAVSTFELLLGYGTNSDAGGTFTLLADVSLNLTAGNWHHLKVVCSGSNHQVFLDDVLYINISDGTYTNPGYVALRVYNGSTTTAITGYFRNFGVALALTGQWISPTLDLSNVGAVGAAFVRTQVAGDLSQTTLTTEISFDNGSSWIICPSVGPATNNDFAYDCETVPGLVPGTNTAHMKQVKIRLTLAISSAGAHLETQGTIFSVFSAYQAVGQRLSHPLSLAQVGRVGSASVAWNGSAPGGTTIQVETAPDGNAWTTAGYGASGGAPIPGINGQPAAIIDTFAGNSADDYAATCAPGGSLAAWSYDTNNSRLMVSGGASALYLYEDQSIKDGYALLDTDTSDGGGLVLHYSVNGSLVSFYYLQISDAQASIAANTVALYKFNASSATLLAGAQISFTRGEPHRFLLQYTSGTLTASMDSVQLLSYSDSAPLAPGLVGLWNAGRTANFYQLYIQGFGDLMTSANNLYTRVTLTSTDPTGTPSLFDLTLSVRSPNIADGALIPSTKYSVLNSTNTIATSLDDLAKQSNALWWIGADLQFYFQLRSATPAPWIATWKDILISGIKVSNIQDAYRNAEWITGGVDLIAFSETVIGDNQATSWSVGYPVHSVQSMLLNGYRVTFGSKGTTGKQFYYEIGSTSITADKSTAVLTDLDTLQIIYTGQVPITVNVRRESEIDTRSQLDGSSGVVELVEDGKGLDKYGCIQLANAHLDQYAQSKTIQFMTLRPGLTSGMLLSVFLPNYRLTDRVFLITDVSTTWQPVTNGSGTVVIQPFYTVQGTEGAIIGDWTRLFVQFGKQ